MFWKSLYMILFICMEISKSMDRELPPAPPVAGGFHREGRPPVVPPLQLPGPRDPSPHRLGGDSARPPSGVRRLVPPRGIHTPRAVFLPGDAAQPGTPVRSDGLHLFAPSASVRSQAGAVTPDSPVTDDSIVFATNPSATFVMDGNKGERHHRHMRADLRDRIEEEDFQLTDCQYVDSGVAGCVWRCTRFGESICALKVLDSFVSKGRGDQDMKWSGRIAQLEKQRIPHVIPILQTGHVDLESAKQYDLIVMEYNPITVQTILNTPDAYKHASNPDMVVTEVKKFAHDVASGMQELRRELAEPTLVHQDMKPANLFLSQRGYLVGDFGLMSEAPPPHMRYQRDFCGTPLYASAKFACADYRASGPSEAMEVNSVCLIGAHLALALHLEPVVNEMVFVFFPEAIIIPKDEPLEPLYEIIRQRDATLKELLPRLVDLGERVTPDFLLLFEVLLRFGVYDPGCEDMYTWENLVDQMSGIRSPIRSPENWHPSDGPEMGSPHVEMGSPHPFPRDGSFILSAPSEGDDGAYQYTSPLALSPM